MTTETVTTETTINTAALILADEQQRVIDLVIRAADERGWCHQANIALTLVYGEPGADGWRDSDGFNMGGYDRDGYDRDGYSNRTGTDREGFNRSGWNPRTGMNREGVKHETFDRAVEDGKADRGGDFDPDYDGPLAYWCTNCEEFHSL